LGLVLKPLNRRSDDGTVPVSWWGPGAAAPAGSSSSDADSHSSSSSRRGAEGRADADELSSSRAGISHEGTDDSSGDESSGGEFESSEGPEDELQLHGGGGTEGVSGGPGGWAVTLEGLKLDNVGVVEVVQAALQISCTRCSSSTTVLLTAQGSSTVNTAAAAAAVAAAGGGGEVGTPGGVLAPAAAAAGRSSSSSSSSRAFEWSGSCSVCQQVLSVLLRPRFVHEGSNVLAGLKAGGCSPLDLLSSVYGATCADCDAVGALRGLQVRLVLL
jgi:hypothetical protein